MLFLLLNGSKLQVVVALDLVLLSITKNILVSNRFDTFSILVFVPLFSREKIGKVYFNFFFSPHRRFRGNVTITQWHG